MSMQPTEPTELSRSIGTELIHEDEWTRVWMLELAPGEATAWHEHEYDYVFVVTAPGEVECQYVDGSVERQLGDPVGSAQYRPRDLAHRLVNVGDRRYQNVVVELRAGGPGPP